jgi:N-acetylneuraminic acid mutarotase
MNSYTPLAALPIGVGRGATVLLDGRIYMIGGEDSSWQATAAVSRSLP